MEQKQETILIVDDDKFLVNLYQKKFTADGWETETALSANEALQKLRNGFSPAAILFDIVMPGVDGAAFLAALKKEKLGEGTALIALTNQSDQATIEKIKGLGVAGYIVKASSVPSEVVELVKGLVEKR
jgi:CheY-like chemotaxis protein